KTAHAVCELSGTYSGDRDRLVACTILSALRQADACRHLQQESDEALHVGEPQAEMDRAILHRHKLEEYLLAVRGQPALDEGDHRKFNGLARHRPSSFRHGSRTKPCFSKIGLTASDLRNAT